MFLENNEWNCELIFNYILSQETSAVIIAQVPIDLIKQKHDFTFPMFHKVRPDGIAKVPQEVPDNKLVRIVGGQVRLGKDFQEQDIYGWDNEFGREIRYYILLTL